MSRQYYYAPVQPGSVMPGIAEGLTRGVQQLDAGLRQQQLDAERRADRERTIKMQDIALAGSGVYKDEWLIDRTTPPSMPSSPAAAGIANPVGAAPSGPTSLADRLTQARQSAGALPPPGGPAPPVGPPPSGSPPPPMPQPMAQAPSFDARSFMPQPDLSVHGYTMTSPRAREEARRAQLGALGQAVASARGQDPSVYGGLYGNAADVGMDMDAVTPYDLQPGTRAAREAEAHDVRLQDDRIEAEALAAEKMRVFQRAMAEEEFDNALEVLEATNRYELEQIAARIEGEKEEIREWKKGAAPAASDVNLDADATPEEVESVVAGIQVGMPETASDEQMISYAANYVQNLKAQGETPGTIQEMAYRLYRDRHISNRQFRNLLTALRD